MSTYKVCVSTGIQIFANTTDSIYLTLMDSNNESSDRTLVNKSFFSALQTEFSFDISVKKDLGDIVQVKLEKEKHFVSYPWFCKQIKVITSFGKCIKFPCYRWIEDAEVIIREGTARLPQNDTGLLKKQRQKELECTQEKFCWKEWDSDIPKCIDGTVKDLPKEVWFDLSKDVSFRWNIFKGVLDYGIGKFKGYWFPLKDVADFEKTLKDSERTLDDFNIEKNLETLMQDWSKDEMFGYQFLNGCNPVMIKKCVEIPDNFPVTDEMEKGFLKRGVTLQEELQAGNIYIADYKILDGVTTSSPQVYLAAPICLFYKDRLDQILPIAIQLSQTPGEKSPIFLPSDNEHDWMLAKMWVKSADFIVHQLVTHLLKTHLISEVFEMAMYRQLSAVHPVYKLLKPHVRFTIAINTKAREKLVNEGGVFSQISSINRAEMDKVMQSAMKTSTYESLRFPEAIKARGMEEVPNYYYRDDGKKIWETINWFVSAVVKIYYDSDEAVQEDEEIQEFVKDVSNGINNSDKFPKSLKTREDLSEYLTVVIFTASAQHAAVNFGQFDWYGWIPNSPSTMRKPPPKQKGLVDMKYIMGSLPDRGCSNEVLGVVWALSRFQKNERFLGMYPEMYFTEKPVREVIQTFQEKLHEVTNNIKSRNKGLTLAYCYLSPDKIPNSVAI